MSAILKLSGVSKRFGSLLAIDNLSMHLNDGEALGVIGPNGSGKTTMFNILTGITKADQTNRSLNVRGGDRISVHNESARFPQKLLANSVSNMATRTSHRNGEVG